MTVTTDAQTKATIEAIERFNEAFNTHDVDAIMRLMTEDVVFDNTHPPDGKRYEGAAAVAGFWTTLFSSRPRAWFDTEDLIATGDRCVTQWLFTFDSDDPSVGHVRGVDIFRVRDGKVCEKFPYVKG